MFKNKKNIKKFNNFKKFQFLKKPKKYKKNEIFKILSFKHFSILNSTSSYLFTINQLCISSSISH